MTDRNWPTIAPLREAVESPAETITQHKSRLGMPVVGVMPAYFPLELIAAAGAYPVQLWGNSLPPGRSDAHLQSFACSLSKSVLELELGGGAQVVDAYAWSSICDTLVNLREIYRRLFDKPHVALEIPQTASPQTRARFLSIVLGQMKEELTTITGQPITEQTLESAASILGETRRLQRDLYDLRRAKPGCLTNHDFYTAIKAAFTLPAADYNRHLSAFIEEVRGAAKTRIGPRIVVSGMYFEPFAMLQEVFDPAGVHIVDDDLANGSRSVRKETLNVSNMTEGLGEYLYRPLPCCCVHDPSQDRRQTLLSMVRESRADGVVFWYQKFCEPDAFDRPQIMAHLRQEGIPCAVIEVELFIRNFDAIRNRIGAFSEMLTEHAQSDAK